MKKTGTFSKKVVNKLKRKFRQDIQVSYNYFMTKKTQYHKIECLNIVFLQYVSGLRIVNNRHWINENDYRAQFTFAKQLDNDTKENEMLETIRNFINTKSYDQATSILVEIGMRFWLSDGPDRVMQWCQTVLDLPELSAVEIFFLKNGQISKKSEQFLYFLTHSLLVPFKYGLQTECSLPFKLVLRVLSFLWKYWWRLLSKAPVRHREISFEILLVTQLTIMENPLLKLPKNYENIFKKKTLALLLSESKVPEKKNYLNTTTPFITSEFWG